MMKYINGYWVDDKPYITKQVKCKCGKHEHRDYAIYCSTCGKKLKETENQRKTYRWDI